ncbi:ferrous iron transport protein A [Candidatus Woesearchaeota archaeon]|jgi:Fe2+ transport system protein FeoA|nr:ferrous iron transport protein A [Candidatus Woesearchaeota archaeon]MBT7237973.1 ferrous iron transport protein A [Candidatus Woesearchaeota archaeon]
MKLSEAKEKKVYIISSCENGWEGKSILYERGIIPGREIVVYRYFQGSGMVQTNSGRFAMSDEYLEKIIIKEKKLHS